MKLIRFLIFTAIGIALLQILIAIVVGLSKTGKVEKVVQTVQQVSGNAQNYLETFRTTFHFKK